MAPRVDTTENFLKPPCFTCAAACREVRCSTTPTLTKSYRKSSRCDDANMHDKIIRLNNYIKKKYYQHA